MIPNFIRSYEASAAIEPYRIVKFSDAASSSKVAHGAASTDPLIGATGKLGASAAGEMVDVFRGGLNQVQLGGSVSAGDPLTSDADGKAIKAVAADDTTIRIIGHAEQPGVEDDVIDFMFAPGTLTKPNAGA